MVIIRRFPNYRETELPKKTPEEFGSQISVKTRAKFHVLNPAPFEPDGLSMEQSGKLGVVTSYGVSQIYENSSMSKLVKCF